MAMRSVETPGGSFGVKTAAELRLSRARAIVSQRPSVRRCTWTVRPANECAPATRVTKRCLDGVRSEGGYYALDARGRPYQLRLGARLVW